ncbi:MAG: class I SAM-dependent methyltransferase [Eubacteriales bacterium]
MHESEIVREYYNGCTDGEWTRLERHSAEFELNLRFMSRYIKPGDRVLDVGGGPSLWLAGLGCEVTLLDLSERNVSFALDMAKREGLTIRALQGDARYAQSLVDGDFDHVLCMGPLYHLLSEQDRALAVSSCLSKLKTGGTFSASFISSFAGVIYWMKYLPEGLVRPDEQKFIECVVNGTDYSGDAFTLAHFATPSSIRRLMDNAGLQKLHFLGSEGIIAPQETQIYAQSPEVVEKWLWLSEKLCEREEYLAYSEHFLYIGRKL